MLRVALDKLLLVFVVALGVITISMLKLWLKDGENRSWKSRIIESVLLGILTFVFGTVAITLNIAVSYVLFGAPIFGLLGLTALEKVLTKIIGDRLDTDKK